MTSISSNNGIFKIRASEGNDNINVSKKNKDIIVTVNDSKFSIKSEDIKELRIYPSSGIDNIKVELKKGDIPKGNVVIFAGSDKDLIESSGPIKVDVRDEEHRNKLHAHAFYGRTEELVETLKAEQLDVETRVDNDVTPLHSAASSRFDKIEALQILVKAGADINAKNDKGITPLDMAISKGHQNKINYLKSLGAETQFKEGIDYF